MSLPIYICKHAVQKVDTHLHRSKRYVVIRKRISMYLGYHNIIDIRILTEYTYVSFTTCMYTCARDSHGGGSFFQPFRQIGHHVAERPDRVHAYECAAAHLASLRVQRRPEW